MQKRNVPWYGLGAIYEQDDIDAVMSILQPCVDEAKGFFRLPEEPNFQKAFAAHEGSAYASAVNSCGTGLDIALQVLDIGPGDEVITSPHTFICTATCILLRGATAVLADIDPVTYNLDPAAAERRITDRTKAIIPVHFAGQPCDVDGFERLRREHGVKIIYDAAHAAGSKYGGVGLGGFGDMAVYSFQSNKNMSTLGEGGAITTNDPGLFDRCEKVKSFGFQYGPTDDVVALGTNYRMSKLQSAVGLTQLGKLDRNNATRREYALMLNEGLSDVPGITVPAEPESSISAWHLYTLLFDGTGTGSDRTRLMKLLKDDYMIGVTLHYRPIWEWSVMQSRGYSANGLPVAERVASQLFNLPLFARMSKDDVEYMIWAVRDAVSRLSA